MFKSLDGRAQFTPHPSVRLREPMSKKLGLMAGALTCPIQQVWRHVDPDGHANSAFPDQTIEMLSGGYLQRARGLRHGDANAVEGRCERPRADHRAG